MFSTKTTQTNSQSRIIFFTILMFIRSKFLKSIRKRGNTNQSDIPIWWSSYDHLFWCSTNRCKFLCSIL